MVEGIATILVVDDEEYTRELLRRILEEADYSVLNASTGHEALEILSSNDVNLVLLDIKMQGMDGYQTLACIREKSNIPVIMVTGVGEISALNTSIDLGADDYIMKPFRTGELLGRVKAKLRRIA